MTRTTANLLLLLAAAIWGAAFIAQATAMAKLSPLWFNAGRFLLSLAVVAPFALVESRRSAAPLPSGAWMLMLANAAVFAVSALLQQQAITATTVTNAGFLTSLYTVFTPIVGLILFREAAPFRVWPAAALGLAGAWLLSGGLTGFAVADALLVLSALGWGLQIVLVGRAVTLTQRPILVVLVQYATTAALSALAAPVFHPLDLTGLAAAWPELLYAGILSGGVAYTLQAVAQAHTRPSDAAILLSTEAPFAALFGTALLGERLTPTGTAGCALIFAAVLITVGLAKWAEARG